MLERFSSTLERLYAAAADASTWPLALGTVQELSGSAGVVVNLVDKAHPEESLLLNSPGINELMSETEVASYNQDVLPHCPRVAWGASHPDARYVSDYMILSEAEMDRDLAYDWYARHGLRYFIGAPLFQTKRYRLMWSLQRTPAQGHAQASDIEMFELLKPHVANALKLADQIGTLRSHERFSSAVLQCLPQALFALDASGAILVTNSRGEALLTTGEALVSSHGQLRTVRRSEEAALDRLVREAALVDVAASSGWTRASRRNGGPPYALFVSPLKAVDDELLAANAAVLVIAHDTAERRLADTAMLISLYGLTDAEARLASALSGGHSIESAAAMMRVQEATARSQLKSVFQKMHVHRQQDLVRLLTSLSTISSR